MLKLPPKRPAKGSSCVIYARYSSTAQNDESIQQQVDKCSLFAGKLGLKVAGVYDDHAVSGRSDKRPAFQKMLKDAAKGEFSYVVAWKSNRIGRNMLQALLNEERLNELGVRIMYVEEDFDDTAAGRFALRNMMNVNQFYSENLAEDSQRGMEANAKECKVNGSIPYGYKPSKDGHFEIDEAKADVVREIFQRVASGESFAEIYNNFNERGLKTATNKPWGKNSFPRIIENEKYKGIYIYKDLRIEGGVPRIVSDDLFERAGEALKMRGVKGRRNGESVYMLTGKLFCGKCKAPMTGYSAYGRHEKYYYYICNNRKVKCCDKEMVGRDLIEEAISRTIRDICLTDEIIDLIADKAMEAFRAEKDNSDIEMLKERLKGVEKGIENILNAIEQGIFTSSTKERLLNLEAEENSLKAEIEREKSLYTDISKEELVAAMQLYKSGDIKDKKYQNALISTFLVKAYLYDDKLEATFNFTGNNEPVEIPIKDDGSPKVTQGVPKEVKRTASYTLYSYNKFICLSISLKPLFERCKN